MDIKQATNKFIEELSYSICEKSNSGDYIIYFHDGERYFINNECEKTYFINELKKYYNVAIDRLKELDNHIDSELKKLSEEE